MSNPSKEPYWHRADLVELAESLHDEDSTSTGVLGVLWRLLDEVERLKEQVDELNAMRR